MITADWRHHDHAFELWLQDETTPWTCIGSLDLHLPVSEVATECRWITAMLTEYDSIEAALPELAGTHLNGPRLEAVRPWALWLAGLHQAVE